MSCDKRFCDDGIKRMVEQVHEVRDDVKKQAAICLFTAIANCQRCAAGMDPRERQVKLVTWAIDNGLKIIPASKLPFAWTPPFGDPLEGAELTWVMEVQKVTSEEGAPGAGQAGMSRGAIAALAGSMHEMSKTGMSSREAMEFFGKKLGALGAGGAGGTGGNASFQAGGGLPHAGGAGGANGAVSAGGNGNLSRAESVFGPSGPDGLAIPFKQLFGVDPVPKEQFKPGDNVTIFGEPATITKVENDAVILQLKAKGPVTLRGSINLTFEE